MSGIKPIFKNVTDTLKTRFKTAQCLLLISVGQEAHEEERFSSTINLINTSFSACVISLYDSLQRHTMALNSVKEPNDFYDVATKEGDLWLARNEKYYSKLTIPTQITRWSAWLNHPDYLNQQNKLRATLHNDGAYKGIFDKTMEGYLDRYMKRLDDVSTFDYGRAQRLCFEYLLEECTVLCLWPELQCQFEIYPNWHNDAIEETRKRFVLPSTPDLLTAIRLGFRNAKQVKPQHFRLLSPEHKIT